LRPLDWARIVSEFWPESEWVTAVAVVGGESDWDERSHYVNAATGDDSYGGFQVNMRGALGPERRQRYGLASNEALFDPATNARVAFDIWSQARSWTPWGAYTSGGYRKYGRYEAAQNAVAELRQGAIVSWYAASSVKNALAQASALWPNRNKGTDGTIGDPAHAASESDHNPDSKGCVHAFDLTHDPAHGVDTFKLADHLRDRANADPAFRRVVKYVISNRRIYNPSISPAWRYYPGDSPHTDHVHVSINYTTEAENWSGAWWQTEGDWFDMATKEDLQAAIAAELDKRGLSPAGIKDMKAAAQIVRYAMRGKDTDAQRFAKREHPLWTLVEEIHAATVDGPTT
jgi:hypothetical protein